MSKFKVEFDTDNEAFFDWDNNPDTGEVVRILEKIAVQVVGWNGPTKFDREIIRDINGNTIGYWEWESDEGTNE